MMFREHNCNLAADSMIIVGNEVLLVKRKNDPFRGQWAIPGGFVERDERLQAAALRELQEETGVLLTQIRQFGVYGEPGRDPRGRTVTFVFWTRLAEKPPIQASDDAADCSWFPLDHLPKLAFDHQQIMEEAMRRLPELDS